MKWPCCLRLPEGRRPGPGDGKAIPVGWAGENVRRVGGELG